MVRVSNAHRFAAAVLLAALSLLALPGEARAHAILTSTDPGIDEVVAGAPEEVTLGFSEPVEIAFGAVRVFDSSGERVDEGRTEHTDGGRDAVVTPLEASLPDGTYTVSWRAVSADSHPVSGAFVFHVGAPGQPPQGLAAAALEGEDGASPTAGALAGAARWMIFGSILALGGAVAFQLLVWRRSPASLTARTPESEKVFERKWRMLVIVSWWTLVGGTLLGFVLQGAVAGGLSITEALSASVISDVSSTRYGKVAIFRGLVLLAGLALWPWLRRSVHVEAVRAGRPAPASVGAAGMAAPLSWPVIAVGSTLVALLAISPGLSGHPGATKPIAANVLADGVHVVSAAAWLGGLLVMLLAGLPAGRVLAVNDRVRALAPVVARYSSVAMWSVGLLVVSGTYRAWVEIRALEGLTGTVYGKVFLAKMAVFLPLLGLGALNNRVVKPRLQRLAAGDVTEQAPFRTIRRTLTAEVLLGALVVGVTALLVNLAPARVEAGLDGPFIRDVAIGDMNVNILIDPNEIGENLVHVTATEPNGRPAEDLDAVEVRFTMPEEDIGPLTGEGRRLGPGHYVVQGRQLSIAGEWNLEFVLRVGEFDQYTKELQVEVNR